MGNNWEEISLKEAGVSLIDCDHRTPPAAPSGYPYISIPQLREGRILLEGVRLISRENLIEWTKKAKPKKFDVMLSRRCNPGVTAVVPSQLECALGQNLVLLRADGSKVHPPFLRWLVRGPEWWEQVRKFINVGAVFDSLKCADIPNFRMKIPPLEVQIRIAEILGTLDEKIELNRKMNETLEQMAKALFKSWFVDFDPVHAKAAGRQPAGINKATSDLFSNGFTETEIGAIPQGWTTKQIGEIADVDKGLSYKGDGLAEEGGLPMVNLGCFTGRGSFNAERIKRYKGEYRERHLLKQGDLVIANTDMTQNRTIIGSPALIPELKGESNILFTHHTFVVRFKHGYDMWRRYVFFTLLKPEFREIAEGFSTGTTVLALPRDGLLKYRICMPPQTLLSEFEAQITPILSAIEANNKESRSIGVIRDTLLPRLLAGTN